MFRHRGDILRELQDVYVSCNLLGAFVAGCTDCKNAHSMNNIKFTNV